MNNIENKGFIFGLVGIMVAIAFVGGLYAGGHLFLQWQHLPSHMLSWHVLFDYWGAYSHVHKLKVVLTVCFLVALAIPLLVLAVFAYTFLLTPQRKLHGDARFANRFEIVKSGLISDKPNTEPSVLVGKYKGDYLKSFGNKPLFLAAPTRSGKGVGVVIPNLLHYSDSIVVLDIKLENYKITSGFRAQHGHEVYLFSPSTTDFKSHRWNPLAYIRNDRIYRVADIQAIANIIYPSGGKDTFWNDNAQALFLGLVLYLLDTPSEICSLSRVIELTAPDSGISLSDWIKEMLQKREAAGEPISSECKNALLSFAGGSDNTKSGILSSVTAPLNVFRDPITAAATSANDFDLRDIRRKRMTVYIGIQPNDLDRFGNLINLFFSQLINENTKALPEQDPSLKYQCLLLMDEFTALGRVGIIEKAIAFMSGYGLRLLMIIQNKSQLVTPYTEHGTRSLLTNMGLKILFAPSDQHDANEYSEILGYSTEKQDSRSRQTGGREGGSISTSDQRRALLLPQEIKAIGPENEVIVLDDGTPPIFTKKIIYYTDAVFKLRMNQPVAHVPTLDMESVMNKLNGVVVREITTIEEASSIPLNQVTNTKEMLASFESILGFSLAI